MYWLAPHFLKMGINNTFYSAPLKKDRMSVQLWALNNFTASVSLAIKLSTIIDHYIKTFLTNAFMKIEQWKISMGCSFPWEEKMIGNSFQSCQHNKIQHFIYTNNVKKLLQNATQLGCVENWENQSGMLLSWCSKINVSNKHSIFKLVHYNNASLLKSHKEMDDLV